MLNFPLYSTESNLTLFGTLEATCARTLYVNSLFDFKVLLNFNVVSISFNSLLWFHSL